MTHAKAKMLNLGLYRLYWKSGGYSLASVGQLHDGTRWFAPCNWTSKDGKGICCTKWSYIRKVVQVEIKP